MHTRRLPSDDMDILQPVLDTVLDAVVAMSPEGRVIAWNEVAERIFGWAEAEAVGVSMAKLIIPLQHRAAHEAGLRRYIATGEERVLRRRIEITALHKDGREFPVELSITLAPLGTGRAFIGFLRDISDRRRSEERQRMLLGELNHRVKNTLAIVQSVASRPSARRACPPRPGRPSRAG